MTTEFQNYEYNKSSQALCEKTITIYYKDLFPRHARQKLKRLTSYYNKRKLPGVYVLWYKRKVVYVGQSKDIEKRIKVHQRDHTAWKWNMFSVITGELEYERRMIEAMLINYYQPLYNKESTNESYAHSTPFVRFN